MPAARVYKADPGQVSGSGQSKSIHRLVMKQNLSSYCFAVVRALLAFMLFVLLSVHEKTFGRPQVVQCDIVAMHFTAIAGHKLVMDRLADLFLFLICSWRIKNDLFVWT